jgi:hypothetical protein
MVVRSVQLINLITAVAFLTAVFTPGDAWSDEPPAPVDYRKILVTWIQCAIFERRKRAVFGRR